MTTITTKEADGTVVEVDGSMVAILTEATPQDAKDRFVAACRRDAEELGQLTRERDENRGQGRNWPAFKNLERKLAALCREAGVIDS